MKSYEPNETLLGDGVGVANFVYFILSGRCQMIETVQVIVTTHLGKNYYTLYDPYVSMLYVCSYMVICYIVMGSWYWDICVIQVPKEESEQDFDQKYFGAYKGKLNKESKESRVSAISEQQVSIAPDGTPSKTNELPRLSSILKQKGDSVQMLGDDAMEQKRASQSSELSKEERSSSNKSQVLFPPTDPTRTSVRLR